MMMVNNLTIGGLICVSSLFVCRINIYIFVHVHSHKCTLCAHKMYTHKYFRMDNLIPFSLGSVQLIYDVVHKSVYLRIGIILCLLNASQW